MDISVVIRCGDDDRVFQCIESIDEDVEVIVSISRNDELQEKLEKLGIKYCLSPRKNLSKTSNIGFENATYNKVIITDSDTVFEKKCIQKLNDALDYNKVACAGIRFMTDLSTMGSNLIAETRDYVNSKKLVFTPGIAVRKDILEDIGGFLFDEEVPYAVDANLDYRIKKAGIPVSWLINDAYIKHSHESLKHDLKAAYRIGKGCREGVFNLRQHPQYKDIKWNELKATKLTDIKQVFLEKGIFAGMYQTIWDFVFYMGYGSQVLKE